MGRRKTPDQIARDNQKKLEKKQKDWDKKAQKNFIKAYNKAADHANNVLIPKINKKYANYDFSKVKTDSYGRPIGNSKLAKAYEKYLKEYDTSFKQYMSMTLVELIGERPK